MRGNDALAILERFTLADHVSPRITERDLAAAWNDGLFRGPFKLSDGRMVEIVHRGSWTHGFGPDFRDGMIAFDGRHLQTGSIELHFVTGGWRSHGHHLDARYDDVVLHVVVHDDGAETRRRNGGLVPVAVLPPDLVARVRPRTEVDWSLVGGAVCAEALTGANPALIREIIWSLGDARLAGKVARLEARLMAVTPADVLYEEIWDGLGYAANREPMRQLAHQLPIGTLEGVLATVPSEERLAVARGLLFGIAGFLPISPGDAQAAGWSPSDAVAAEQAWLTFGSAWRATALAPTAWTRARVRPANHPALRLEGGAALIASAGAGLLPLLVTTLRQQADLTTMLRDRCSVGAVTPLGLDRAAGIVVNGMIPFALALAEHAGDHELGDAASQLWESIPAAESNNVTRRALKQVAGASRLTGLGARGQQGLIHLDQTLCAPRRCFECPIASAVVATTASPDG